MTERYLTFTEETNALDYLERAVRFIHETAGDDRAWKWVVIALHGALYGFAVCACKGTDYEAVTNTTKKGERKLITFREALAACQNSSRMSMSIFSKPLVLSTEQEKAIDKLQKALRNPFEHFIPSNWTIEMHGMPAIAIHCLAVIQTMALEIGNYTNLAGDQKVQVERLCSEAITFLRTLSLYKEGSAHEC